MSVPENNTPLQNPAGDPKVNAVEQDVITNSDETDKIVNQDGVVADTAGIQETLSESEPSTALNADRDITNDTGTGEILSEGDIN